MSEPLVNVIIPAYLPTENHLRLLQLAVSSLSEQTHTDFSVSLVLNGLYCGKQEVMDAVKDFRYPDRLIIYNMEAKTSGAKARNYGIRRTNAKYIAQLDADDAYMPEKLEKQVAYMEEHPKCDLLGTLMYYKKEDGSVTDGPFRVNEYKDHSEIANQIAYGNVLSHGTVMLRNESYKSFNLQYDEVNVPGTSWPNYGKIMYEDWDLWQRSIAKGVKTHVLQERLYLYSLGTSVAR